MAQKSPRPASVFGSGLLSACFLYAGVMKLISGPSATYLALGSIGLEWPALVRWLAVALPVIEILLGLWLVSGIRESFALLTCIAAFSLFSAIAIMVGSNVGWTAPCTCTGSLRGEPVWLALGRNAVLLVLSIWLFKLCPPKAAGKAFAA